MGAFGIPLSGLQSSQATLQTISNNLANLDTVGYKDQTTSFGDLFAQSSMLNGANEPISDGLGAQVSQITSNFTDGSQSSTGISSNLALQGNGLFVVRSSSGDVDYSRAGNFTTNADGQLTTPSGALVLGYPATNGVVSTGSPLQPLTVGSAALPATATTSFSFTANLNAASTAGATFSSTTPLYDSLGNSHELTINYTNLGSNSWSYSVNIPTADTGASTTQVASGTLAFNNSGILVSPTGSVNITIPTLTDGAAPVNVAWNLNDSHGNPTITQTALASATSAVTQNGYTGGALTSYTIQSNGIIEGTFSNGQNSAMGQVALAGFANVQGLEQLGGNLYQASSSAGVPVIGIAGQGGLGTMTSGSIEASNVDVATEFSNLVVAQQAYQANARSVTTQDQILQTTIQMLSA
jgi:flagellar hook protein FlgE